MPTRWLGGKGGGRARQGARCRVDGMGKVDGGVKSRVPSSTAALAGPFPARVSDARNLSTRCETVQGREGIRNAPGRAEGSETCG